MARAALTAGRRAVGRAIADRGGRPAEGTAGGLLGRGVEKTAGVLSIRVLLLGAGIAIGVLLPLCASRDDVGLVFLAQSLIAVAATLAQLGLSYSASALLPAALALGDTGRVRTVAVRSLALAALAGATVGALLWLALTWIEARSTTSLAIGALAVAAPLIAASVPLAALQTLMSELYRGLGAVLRASLLATGASLPVAIALIGAWAAGLRLTFDAVLGVGLVGFVALAGLGGIGLARRAARWNAEARTPIRTAELWASAWPNLVLSLVLFVLGQADLWIVALLGDTGTLANYGLGLRMATLVTLPLAIVNVVAGPMIAVLWTRRKPRVLQRLLLRVAAVASTGAAAGYSLVLAIGEPLVERLWGADYGDVLLYFSILGFGQLCHAAGGSSGVALIVLGRQREVMRISAATGGLTVVLAALAAAWLNATGIALAFSAGLIAQTWLFSRALHRSFNVDATVWHAVALLRRRAVRP